MSGLQLFITFIICIVLMTLALDVTGIADGIKHWLRDMGVFGVSEDDKGDRK